MKRIRINEAELDKFSELQNPKKKPKDCHAAFSTNPSEDTWSFATWGLTPKQLREEVRNRSPKLDQVFGIFIELPDKRPKGGRFFIDWEGVYWKDRDLEKHRFVDWEFEGPRRIRSKPISIDDLPENLRGAFKVQQEKTGNQ